VVLLRPITLATAGLLTAALLTSIAPISSTALYIIWLAWGILLLRAIWRTAEWSGNYLVVTSGRMLLVQGLVNRKLSTILLSDVTDLNMRRSLTGSLFAMPCSS
jgi:hypothetical protein